MKHTQTTFRVENKCLVIQQGDTETTFNQETTEAPLRMMIRKIYGQGVVVSKGNNDEQV